MLCIGAQRSTICVLHESVAILVLFRNAVTIILKNNRNYSGEMYMQPNVKS
jgi:hypothetical protein